MINDNIIGNRSIIHEIVLYPFLHKKFKNTVHKTIKKVSIRIKTIPTFEKIFINNEIIPQIKYMNEGLHKL